jgi:hypothetical protein
MKKLNLIITVALFVCSSNLAHANDVFYLFGRPAKQIYEAVQTMEVQIPANCPISGGENNPCSNSYHSKLIAGLSDPNYGKAADPYRYYNRLYCDHADVGGDNYYCRYLIPAPGPNAQTFSGQIDDSNGQLTQAIRSLTHGGNTWSVKTSLGQPRPGADYTSTITCRGDNICTLTEIPNF